MMIPKRFGQLCCFTYYNNYLSVNLNNRIGFVYFSLENAGLFYFNLDVLTL